MKKLIYILICCPIIFLTSCSSGGGDSVTACQFTGNWSGTYTGDESGTLHGTISASCAVSGDVIPSGSAVSYPASGSVTSGGNFSATVGSVSTGAVFEGQLSGNTGSGTWTNLYEGMQGTWQVSKQ
jgi:hypothetical protein